MTVATRRGRSGYARLTTFLSITALGLAACSGDKKSPAGPELPGEPDAPPAFRQASFIFDVSPSKRTVKVTAPSGATAVLNLAPSGARAPSRAGASLSIAPNDAGKPAFSLFGGDAIELVTSNPTFTPPAAGNPRSRVTFGLQVRNRLSGYELITPTFPTPPTGVEGVLLFPFQFEVTASSGSGSVGSDGNVVIVVPPGSGGTVQPDSNWVTPPHNFFNDTGCPDGSNDCFPYEVFGTIGSSATSEMQTIGFEYDPGVGDFRVRMIVAGDLRAVSDTTPPGGADTLGTVAGRVTSPELGPLAGVTVTADSGGPSDVTDSAGAYLIENVRTGSRTISLSDLPAACTAPAPQTVTVDSMAVDTVDFTVTCTPDDTTGGADTLGTVAGRVTSPELGPLAGVTVSADSGGPSDVTDSTGSYLIENVRTGLRSISLSNLPASCTAPAAQPATVDSVAVDTVDFSVTCADSGGVEDSTGAVSGRITSDDGDTLSGVVVTLTPDGGSPLVDTTSAAGEFSFDSVLVGTGGGSIALSGLPATCEAPASLTYTGLTAGGTVTRNIEVECDDGGAAVTYPLSLQFGEITGSGAARQVTLTLAIDMGSAPGRPDINGAGPDSLAGIQVSIAGFDPAVLTFAEGSEETLNPRLNLAVVGASTPGIVNVAVASTTGRQAGGDVQLVRLTFDIAAGASGTIATTTEVVEALATIDLIQITSGVTVSEASITIP